MQIMIIEVIRLETSRKRYSHQKNENNIECPELTLEKIETHIRLIKNNKLSDKDRL